MSKIKKFLSVGLFLIVMITIVILLSIRGERVYLDNCKTLSLECEPGRVHQMMDKIEAWMNQEKSHEKLEIKNQDSST